jgi:hypothetical protein
MEFLLMLVFKLVLVFAGAILIRSAINEFKKEEYFSFGVSVMIVLLCALEMIKLVFEA